MSLGAKIGSLKEDLSSLWAMLAKRGEELDAAAEAVSHKPLRAQVRGGRKRVREVHLVLESVGFAGGCSVRAPRNGGPVLSCGVSHLHRIAPVPWVGRPPVLRPSMFV